MSEIIIPYKPRNWAKTLHTSYSRFGALLLHRRAGKTTAVMNHHQRAALNDEWERGRLRHLNKNLTPKDIEEIIHPPGGRHYGHVMPSLKQAKLSTWDKLKFYASSVPGVRFNEQELLVRYPNGSKLQLFGSDDPDKLRGPGFCGLSFDEYSQQPGNIFSEVLSKGLADRLGYALFVGTVKGKDQLWETYHRAKDDPEWLTIWQDIDRSLTTEDSATVKVLQQAMEDDRKLIAKGLMTQDEYDQEWYLSTDAAVKGAYYGKEMLAALQAGRITRVPYDPALPVDTDWDLGMDDYTAIIFSQSLRSGEIRIIDFYANSGEGLSHYIRVLRDRGYVYGKHYPPHDIAVRELGTGKSRKETAAELGLKFEHPLPALEVIDGIDAARLILARCWFDSEKTGELLECLRNYRKSWNQRTESFTDRPVHDWASHGADAFRGLAVRWQLPRESEQSRRLSGVAMPRVWSWS